MSRRIPAFRGELGLKVYSHAPQVYALCQREPCVVEIESGDEALYPAADEWQVTERAHDDTRYGSPPDLGVEPERFVPEPHERQDMGPVDVVVCPRKREYGSAKNWPHWPHLIERLRLEGLDVFAAGAPDSSYPVDAPTAWDHIRFLDASIEAIRKAGLVVATDAGLAHLAVLCGAHLLVVTHEGRVAPGPVVDSSGRMASERYQRAGWDRRERVDRFADANHTGSLIEYVDGWMHPERVRSRVSGLVGEKQAA